MQYVLETKFNRENSSSSHVKDDTVIAGGVQSSICFNINRYPDDAYPALIFIHADGVNYKRNKVSFNGNFLGYLSARTSNTILEVDNRVEGKLKQFGNRLSITACDFWGNTAPASPSELDNFNIISVQVAYSSKKPAFKTTDSAVRSNNETSLRQSGHL